MKASIRGAVPTFFLACLLSIIWAPPARSKTITIDDSGTQALEPSVSMRWKSASPSRTTPDNTMVGTTTIRVRINVMPWLRRSGKIYLNLPAQQPGPITASWITQGRLMPGQVHSGNRVLVYAGPISTPFMEDVLRFQFSVDGALIRRAVPVTFHFEMDED
jgi:predicted small secreted protein